VWKGKTPREEEFFCVTKPILNFLMNSISLLGEMECAFDCSGIKAGSDGRRRCIGSPVDVFQDGSENGHPTVSRNCFDRAKPGSARLAHLFAIRFRYPMQKRFNWFAHVFHFGCGRQRVTVGQFVWYGERIHRASF
jgi:hypothetical protein